MTENDRVFDAFRNCITEPKCKDCPWTECDKLKERRVEIPIDLALAVMRMLKVEEPDVAYWIPCNGKSHIWYCSKCGEKINYNDARRTYKTEKKPVEAVNRYCRGCGATMVQRPTDEQREKVKWDETDR